MLLFYLSLIDDEEGRAKITKIYEEYLGWMLKMAFHYLKNQEDAEDAVNDAFLSVIEGNCAFPSDDDKQIKAYLFICVRNSAFRIKRLKNKNKTTNYEELFNLSVKYNLEDDISSRDNCNELYSFISTMSPIYKDVLTLKILFDKTLKEISKMLQLPLKTVQTRYLRGKAILRERLGNDIEI